MLLHLDGRKLLLLCIGDLIAFCIVPEPPKPIRKFCRECAVAVSGKGCMRRSRRGRARRRRQRHSASRRERGPPGDDGDGPPPQRLGELFTGRRP